MFWAEQNEQTHSCVGAYTHSKLLSFLSVNLVSVFIFIVEYKGGGAKTG